MTQNNNNILKVENLNITVESGLFKKKRTPLIITSDFYVNKGEIVIIQGPNGSGKSSILKAITAQHSKRLVTEKSVFYRGTKIEKAKDFSKMYKTIAFTKQTQYYSAINAMEYVKSNIDNYQYKDEIDDQAIVNLFNQFNKEDLLKQPNLSKFSGGEKRILSLLAAFIKKKADMFILDEPLNDLDYETAKKVNEYLQVLKKNSGILIISHCRMHLDIDRAYVIKKTNTTGVLLEVPKPHKCAVVDLNICHN